MISLTHGLLKRVLTTLDGDMDISVYGYHVLTEQEKSKSTQTSVYLSVGYTF